MFGAERPHRHAPLDHQRRPRQGKLSGDPNLVEPGTAEVNPVRRDVIDNVGRRYAVGDVFA
jgi:hypothetical protein